MYYLALAIATWAVAPWILDWRQLRRTLPIGLTGAFVSTGLDFAGDRLGLWRYQDTRPLHSHDLISVAIHLSAAPVIAMLFAQGLHRTQRARWLRRLVPDSGTPWLYILFFSFLSLLPEAGAELIGRIVYGRPWSLTFSFGVYVVMWWGLYWLDRWWRLERLV